MLPHSVSKVCILFFESLWWWRFIHSSSFLFSLEHGRILFIETPTLFSPTLVTTSIITTTITTIAIISTTSIITCTVINITIMTLSHMHLKPFELQIFLLTNEHHFFVECHVDNVS